MREDGAAKPLAIVAAVILPPLGVYLDQGMTPAFWITAALTVLFFVPGIAFALFTILRPRAPLQTDSR